MALYVVVLPGTYKVGQHVEDLDDMPGYVQPVQLVNDPDQRRAVRWENYGMAMPLGKVRETLLRVQKHGLDREPLRARGYSS
jgi:hypothetical protein